MYNKIERDERKVKREQVRKIAKLFETDEKELLTHWLGEEINELIKKDEEIAKKRIKVVEENL